MYITPSPMRRDETLCVQRTGDRLSLNGATLDLSGIAEGAIAERESLACHWLASDVCRKDGVLHLSLIVPHGADAPDAALFPEPFVLMDGAVVLLGAEAIPVFEEDAETSI